jgi:hypothetical protein
VAAVLALLLVALIAGGTAADDATSDDVAGAPRTPGCSNKFQLVTTLRSFPAAFSILSPFLIRAGYLLVVPC